MRELSSMEIFEVGGGLNFTSAVTFKLLNNVAEATTVGKWVSASFTAGYLVGTYLNNQFDISTRIVDALLD